MHMRFQWVMTLKRGLSLVLHDPEGSHYRVEGCFALTERGRDRHRHCVLAAPEKARG